MRMNSHWKEELPLQESLDILRDLALHHCNLAGAMGLEIATLIKESRWKDLCDYEFDYNAGYSVNHYIHARQAMGFFQKLESLEVGVDKEEVAWVKFVEAEEQCRQTNEVFRKWRAGQVSFLPAVVLQLFAAQRKIHRILGVAPKVWDLHGRFGPGATTDVKRRDACPMNKLASGIACSMDLYASGALPSILRRVPHWTAALNVDYYVDDDGWLCESVPVSISTGTLRFVPKSAKTYRSIVVEPGLNSYLQQGILRHMMARLSQYGIDLKDQSANQRLARIGSLTGEYATLDLSSASDTISTELVKFLLPSDWYTLLASTRTSSVSYRGTEMSLEKFSSMGNAFTFPLESLIFWALTKSACGGAVVSVYGDDIICPGVRAEKVITILTTCGFTVNLQKSFWTGQFRESCGADYYFGIDIRPYYQKHLISGQTLFVLHNFYFRHYDTVMAMRIRDLIHPSLHIFGPDSYGDGHLLGDWSPVRKGTWMNKGYSGFSFDTFVSIGTRVRSKYPGDWVTPLYHIYDRGLVPLHQGITGISEPQQGPEILPSGQPCWRTPGSRGYKRVSVYTLSPV